MAICPDWLCDMILGSHAHNKKVLAKFRLEVSKAGSRKGITDCTNMSMKDLRRIGNRVIRT